VFGQELENETRDLIVFLVQGEMTGIEAMYFGVGQIALVRLRAGSDERGIVAPPNRLYSTLTPSGTYLKAPRSTISPIRRYPAALG
jgi:hypothetical protein